MPADTTEYIATPRQDQKITQQSKKFQLSHHEHASFYSDIDNYFIPASHITGGVQLTWASRILLHHIPFDIDFYF